MREHALGELASDTVSRRSAAGVDDAAPAVAALEPEPLVEVDAELDEVADARRRLVRQHLDGTRPTQPAARAQRVLGVQRRCVVLPHRGGDTALREEARGRQQRALREDEDVALGRRTQGGEETGDPPADDDEREIGLRACMRAVRHGSFRL